MKSTQELQAEIQQNHVGFFDQAQPQMSVDKGLVMESEVDELDLEATQREKVKPPL